VFSSLTQSAYSDKSIGKLQEFFSAWKENNYQGELFPSSLNLNPSPTLPAPKLMQTNADTLFFTKHGEEKTPAAAQVPASNSPQLSKPLE